jgi:hypothetical protein
MRSISIYDIVVIPHILTLYGGICNQCKSLTDLQYFLVILPAVDNSSRIGPSARGLPSHANVNWDLGSIARELLIG